MGPVEARVIVRRGAFTLDVEIDLQPGTTTVIVGPNGAGKTTVLHAIAGLVPLTEGRVRLGGRVVDEPADGRYVGPADRRIGLVLQGLALFPHLDATDNVAFGLAARGVGRRERRVRAASMLDRLGVGDLGDRRPDELSGGQAQRVALARALAIEPDVLLLDEPLSALDAATRSSTRRFLRSHLADLAAPRLIVTHDPVDAFALADSVLVIESGRLTQVGTPEDLQRRPASAYVAELVDRNLLSGVADLGVVQLEAGPVITAADRTLTGPVLVSVPPAAVSLHRLEPEGSPRNVWSTVIDEISPVGDLVRVTLGPPLAIRVDITRAAAADLDVRPGTTVWASVKATEVELTEA